jgi:putative tryptophan/tyrosine transport system substrate-binding protein
MAHADGVVFAADPFFSERRDLIAAHLERLRLPAISGLARRGLLLSYGPSIPDVWRMTGLKVTRVLQGTKPADLPVERATRFILSVNLEVAKALGLTVPPTLLARADEVIE